MECLKTGCHAYLQQYDLYAYGDAHVDRAANGLLVLRIVDLSQGIPVSDNPIVHIDVAEISEWFDRNTTAPHHPSTLLTRHWHWWGYDGANVADAAAAYGRTLSVKTGAK